MIVDMPATTVSAMSSRLLSLRENVGAMSLTRVLTLVVLTEDKHAERALTLAASATRQHPSRIVCVVTPSREPAGSRGSRNASRIDGQIRVGGDAGASEILILKLFGDLTRHARSVVLPLLLADSPVVAWWPSDAPADVSADPVGSLAHRRITDTEHSSVRLRSLAQRARTYQDGDTDLAWARTTKWRTLLAAALDQPPYEPVKTATVCGARDSGSADLLAGWLAARLGCETYRGRTPNGTGLVSVRLIRKDGVIDLVRPDGRLASLEHPGQPSRRFSLTRRSDSECLADELARLEPDDIYAEALLVGLGRIPPGNSLPASEAVARGLAPSLDEARKTVESGSGRRGSPGTAGTASETEESPAAVGGSGTGIPGARPGASARARARTARRSRNSPARGGAMARAARGHTRRRTT